MIKAMVKAKCKAMVKVKGRATVKALAAAGVAAKTVQTREAVVEQAAAVRAAVQVHAAEQAVAEQAVVQVRRAAVARAEDWTTGSLRAKRPAERARGANHCMQCSSPTAATTVNLCTLDLPVLHLVRMHLADLALDLVLALVLALVLDLVLDPRRDLADRADLGAPVPVADVALVPAEDLALVLAEDVALEDAVCARVPAGAAMTMTTTLTTTVVKPLAHHGAAAEYGKRKNRKMRKGIEGTPTRRQGTREAKKTEV
jgi:hypothetical protein